MAGFGAHGSSCEAWAEDLESRIEAVVLGLRCLYYQACVAGLRCAGLVEGGLWMQTLASWPVAVPAKRESMPGLEFWALGLRGFGAMAGMRVDGRGWRKMSRG